MKISGEWRSLSAYLSIALPAAFLWLGAVDVHVMEGIIADGARYMEREREFVVPHLHGEVYNYKPPGAYWMVLGSQWIFGSESEWTLRLPFAVSGVLMGLAVLWLAGEVLGPRGGLWSAAAALTNGMVLLKLNLAEWDVALTAGVGLAVAVACRNLDLERMGSALWLVGYLGLAFGFLVKGLPAVLLYFPGLVVAAGLTGRFKDLLRPAHLAGVALFGTVSSAWILAAASAEGWTALTQPLAEAGTKTLEWDALAFVWLPLKPVVVVASMLPWSIALIAFLTAESWRQLPAGESRLARSALGFSAAGIVLLTLTAVDEMRYFLPLAVPLGILCGVALDGPARSAQWRRSTSGAARALAGLFGAAALVVGLRGLPAFGVEGQAHLLALVVGLVTLGRAVLPASRGRRQALAPLLLATALCVWLINAAERRPNRAAKRSLRSVAEQFEPHLESGKAVWTTPVHQTFHHSGLFFYLRRPVRTITDTSRPEAGDHVVIFSDEPYGQPQYVVPVDYSVVASASRRGTEFVLGRVE